MNHIPIDATQLQQNAFRAVWKAIDGLEKRSLNMHGHQITNLGDARSGSDALTLRQYHKMSQDPNARREVLTIVQREIEGPWVRVGAATKLLNTADQVGIGLTAFPSTIPKLHVRNAAAATFPTIAANDYLILENSAAASIALVGGATSNFNLKFYGSGDTNEDGRIQYNRNVRSMTFMAAATVRVQITAAGSLLCQVAGALATTAVDGFTYLPTCAGVPTGTPTAQTGMAPIVVDTTNSKVYVYSGGAWQILN